MTNLPAPAHATAAGRLWCLNFDAELELACHGAYTPRALTERAGLAQRAVAAALLEPSDAWLDPLAPAPTARGLVGRAWCPTPSALRRLEQAGAVPEPAPPLEVLRQVNDRRFCLGLQRRLPGHVDPEAVADELDLDRALERLRHGPLLFKRPLSCSGRGQLVLRREPSPHERRLLGDALRRDGLTVERYVPLLCELSVHGLLTPAGTLRLGQACRQTTDAHRSFVRAERLGAGTLTAAEHACLMEAAHAVAQLLASARYFGPFGLDAFVWLDGEQRRINPLSEINARYTMAFGVGFGVGPALAPAMTRPSLPR